MEFPVIFAVFLVTYAPVTLSQLDQKLLTLPTLKNVDNYAFENDIRDFLERIRDLLKNGDPENNIPPMEPLPLENFDFNFILEDSKLKGYLNQMLVHNISDFVVRDVQFQVVGLKLTLGLSWDLLKIEGMYKLSGNVFEEAVEGRGDFLSETTKLDLDFYLHIGSNLNRTVIKELSVDFSLVEDHITFTNSMTDGLVREWDSDFLIPRLYRIRDVYFPLLLNTLSLVGSDVIHDVTLDELIQIIIGIIQGNGWMELLKYK